MSFAPRDGTRDEGLVKRARMTSPTRYLARMAIFLAIVIALVALLSDTLIASFRANPAINGLILGVLVIGIAFVIRQVMQLRREVTWIEGFRGDRPSIGPAATPRLLAPMVTLLGDRRERVRLSPISLRSILDSISTRLDESRDLSRYLVGLLIFLGLLGTFWGLLGTVRSVADVIAGLEAGGGDTVSIFQNLTSGLEAPLAGMSTAFSSSLFGLAGSLLLGFLDLQASQAQNRFYNELEEWLSGLLRLSGGLAPSGDGEEEAASPAYIQALLGTTAESLDTLQRALAQSEESRHHANAALVNLATQLTTLADQLKHEQTLLTRLTEAQEQTAPALRKLAGGLDGGMDEATRAHIRNLDVYLSRLSEEAVSGRNQVVNELRTEIRLLARTIAASAETGENHRQPDPDEE